MGDHDGQVVAASSDGGGTNAEDEWEVECSDEELQGSYTPPPETIVKLFTALANKEPIQLSWQCPPKRPLTPDVSESEEEEEVDQTNESQTNVKPEATEFDFADSSPSLSKAVQLRKGATKLPLSAQKRVGQFQNVVKMVNRHTLEEKELQLQKKHEQQKLASLQQLPQPLHQEQNEQQNYIPAVQQEQHATVVSSSCVSVSGPDTMINEGMDWQTSSTSTHNIPPHIQSFVDENLPTDIDIDPDFQSLTIKTDKASIEQYIADTQLDQIDPSDFALISDLHEVGVGVGVGEGLATANVDLNTMVTGAGVEHPPGMMWPVAPGTPAAPALPGQSTATPGLPGQSTAAPGLPGQSSTAPALPGQSTAAPGQSIAAPGLPGQSTAAPSLPGQSAAVSVLPGQATAALSVHGQSTVAPGLPGQSAVAPGLPCQSTAASSLPGQSTVAPVLPGQSTVAPVLPGQSTVAPVLPGQTTGAPTLPAMGITTTTNIMHDDTKYYPLQ